MHSATFIRNSRTCKSLHHLIELKVVELRLNKFFFVFVKGCHDRKCAPYFRVMLHDVDKEHYYTDLSKNKLDKLVPIVCVSCNYYDQFGLSLKLWMKTRLFERSEIFSVSVFHLQRFIFGLLSYLFWNSHCNGKHWALQLTWKGIWARTGCHWTTVSSVIHSAAPNDVTSTRWQRFLRTIWWHSLYVEWMQISKKPLAHKKSKGQHTVHRIALVRC